MLTRTSDQSVACNRGFWSSPTLPNGLGTATQKERRRADRPRLRIDAQFRGGCIVALLSYFLPPPAGVCVGTAGDAGCHFAPIPASRPAKMPHCAVLRGSFCQNA